jgi:hypothetical protein
MTSIPPPWRNTLHQTHIMNHHLRTLINLIYTFNCYGAEKVPFYKKELVGRPFRWRLPSNKPNALYFYLEVNRSLKYRVRVNNPVHHPGLRKYYEPSIKKINKQLAELHKETPWQCVSRKNNIYFIKQID